MNLPNFFKCHVEGCRIKPTKELLGAKFCEFHYARTLALWETVKNWRDEQKIAFLQDSKDLSNNLN